MMVKDFNRHKSNGGIAQPMTINVIETCSNIRKVVEMAARMKQAVRIEVAQIKLVINVT